MTGLELLVERINQRAIAEYSLPMTQDLANAVDNWKYVQKGSVWSFSSTRWVMTGSLLQADE
jgi:hypothetical protein